MINIIEIVWNEDRQDWQVDYEDSRNGVQRGRRYIALPIESTEQDIKDFIEAE